MKVMTTPEDRAKKLDSLWYLITLLRPFSKTARQIENIGVSSYRKETKHKYSMKIYLYKK